MLFLMPLEQGGEGGVLTIDGDYAAVMPTGSLEEQRPSTDDGLLVGQGEVDAPLKDCKRGPEAGKATDGIGMISPDAHRAWPQGLAVVSPHGVPVSDAS